MVQLFQDGGGFMYPILIILIFGISFVGERLYHLISGLHKEDFAQGIADTILAFDEDGNKIIYVEEQSQGWEDQHSKGLEAALEKCEASQGPVSNLCYAAIEKGGDGVEAAEKAIEQSAGIEMASLEKNMTWISLSIAIAPMFGFLGTVWGMIEAFNDIKAANDISPKVVAGGISVALLTTAFGLVAALILQFLQNLVMYIIDNQIVTMQKSTVLILDRIAKLNRTSN